MGANPAICPECGEINSHNIDYCAMCGTRFKAPVPIAIEENGKESMEEQKARMKLLKKKRELEAQYRERKITRDQYLAGLSKLGFASDVEKAVEFKKFIRDQIEAFEKMNVKDGWGPKKEFIVTDADLIRDDNGEAVVDFMVHRAPIAARPYPMGTPVEADPFYSEEELGRAPGPSRGPSSRKAPQGPEDSGKKRTPGPEEVKKVRLEAEWDEEKGPEVVFDEDFEKDEAEEEGNAEEEESWGGEEEADWGVEEEDEEDGWGSDDEEEGGDFEMEVEDNVREEEEDWGMEDAPRKKKRSIKIR